MYGDLVMDAVPDKVGWGGGGGGVGGWGRVPVAILGIWGGLSAWVEPPPHFGGPPRSPSSTTFS